MNGLGSRIAATGLTKRFGGLVAVDGVSLRVEPGEIVGLIGPNGAGKTTLFDLLSGVLKPDAGRLAVDGIDVSGAPPHRLAQLGLVRTFQPLAGARSSDRAGERGGRDAQRGAVPPMEDAQCRAQRGRTGT
ncbi:ATP-binding cassette domain-containing protein [Rhodopseudomonas palustris]|nr:ATP-binding cassette domain-containing protein [Rhodopseudomonas palustris]